jgi:hypothetical protein
LILRAVGDAREILANIGGNRGHPGSCAWKRWRMSKGSRGTSGFVTGGVLLCHPWWPVFAREITADVLMTSIDLSVADALVDSGSMV